MNVEYRLIRKKNGKIIEDSGWKPSRSYVIQFLRWLYCVHRAAQDVTLTDTGGATRTIVYFGTYGDGPYSSYVGYVMAGSGNDAFGIQVGTGTTTPTNTDYSLQSKIANGTGSGQLVYGSQQETDPAITAEGNVDFLLTRDFTNSSGATITVNEIGVVIRVYDTGGSARYFLILRDVVTAHDVLNGETLTVQYKLRTTV